MTFCVTTARAVTRRGFIAIGSTDLVGPLSDPLCFDDIEAAVAIKLAKDIFNIALNRSRTCDFSQLLTYLCINDKWDWCLYMCMLYLSLCTYKCSIKVV